MKQGMWGEEAGSRQTKALEHPARPSRVRIKSGSDRADGFIGAHGVSILTVV